MRKSSLTLCALATIVVAGLAFAQDRGIQAVIGNVFLQNTTPGTAQGGHATITGTFRAGQLFAQQTTATTIPVVGNNVAVGAGFAYGGSFSSGQQSGTGVRGTATSTTGITTGVYGEARSKDGRGVVGNSPTGLGVLGLGNYGVEGIGVLAGVWGQTNSPGGSGVEAVSTNSVSPALLARNTVQGGLAARFSGDTEVFGGLSVTNGTIGSVKAEAFPTGPVFSIHGTASGDFITMNSVSPASSIRLAHNSQVLVSAAIGNDGIGRLTADVKNFVQPDPDDDQRDIVYASVEGPEAAAYVRGTARLVNGVAHVALPRHFQNVSVADGMTVQLTPLSADSEGLAIVRKSTSGFDVRELRKGHGNYEFDWEVKAVRRGFTGYKVYRPWDESMPSNLDRANAMAGRHENARKVYGIQYAGKRP